MLRWWLFAAIFISCYQLGGGKSGLYLEVASIGLGLWVLFWLKDNWRSLKGKASGKDTLSVMLIATNALYLLWDVITWSYSPQKNLFFLKYPIVAVTLLICIGMLIYINSFDQLGKVKIWIGLPAIALVLVSLINFYFPVFLPTYYSLRLSLRSDYNMFATAIYISGVTFLSQEMKKKDINIGRLLAQFSIFALFMGVIVLSGSRRILLLLPMWVMSFITILIKQIQDATKNILYSVAVVLGGIITASSIAVLLINGVDTEMDRRHQVSGSYGTAEKSTSDATSYVDRIDSTAKGGLLTKRLVIWGLAFEEVAKLEGSELAFGKGGGYSIVMYDSIDEPIDTLYPNKEKRMGALSPHNMVLADMLDGGVIKVALLLAMLLSLLFNIIEFWWRFSIKGRLYILVFTAITLGSFISNKFGLIYDRHYYMFTLLILLERKLSKEDPNG